MFSFCLKPQSIDGPESAGNAQPTDSVKAVSVELDGSAAAAASNEDHAQAPESTRALSVESESSAAVAPSADDEDHSTLEIHVSRTVRERPSLWHLQREFDAGNRKPLEDVLRAFHAMQKMHSSHPHSYYRIAGYHGAPFIMRHDVEHRDRHHRYLYWGGYCHHGNVLFPTWHRLFTLKFEDCLRSHVPDVSLPYWDETDHYTRSHGLPPILTKEKIMLDGEYINNPLHSFKLPHTLHDPFADRKGTFSYAKPYGYETKRYPLSGLVGTKHDRHKTEHHNEHFARQNVEALLNRNVVNWLRGPHPRSGHHSRGVASDFQACLRAPNYTLFSNNTSADHHNSQSRHGRVMSVENPHDSMHLCVGGFDSGIISGATGDMGENNTAAFDPMFWFHHCFIDRLFWLWQVRHGKQRELDVMHGYPGTSSSAHQGPTPGLQPGEKLDMRTPLHPFVKEGSRHTYRSEDVVDIHRLGYSYASGSLESTLPEEEEEPSKCLVVRGIDRSLFEGSFVVNAYADLPGGEVVHLGMHPVLSRFNVSACGNCLNHLEVIACFPLSSLAEAEISSASFHIVIQHRQEALPSGLRYSCTVDGMPAKMTLEQE